MVTNHYLVVAGVPSIKKYVFGTDRLKEIRGASALLEDLTRNQIVDYLQGCLHMEVEIIFTGGGAGQFIIKTDEATIDSVLKTFESEFSKRTHGGAILNWGKADYDRNNYNHSLKTAELEVIKKLEEHPFAICTQLHTGFIRECDSCDNMVSRIPENDNDDDLIICDVCRAKVEFNYQTRKSFFYDFLKYLHTKGINTEPPESFEHIGKQCKTKKGYTALVYADGNNMGAFIKNIDTKERFRFFSHVVDDGIREACHEALYESCYQEAHEHSKVVPAEILMLGGDDLLVYLSADNAFPFAIKVAEKFNSLTKKKMLESPEGDFFLDKSDGKGLTISLGVVFGKSHTPFSIMLDQAEELLTFAKRKGANDVNSNGFYVPTYIDFHITSSFNQIHVANNRLNHLELPGKMDQHTIKLYQKPYSLEDAKALLRSAKDLVESGIPNARLHRMGNAPSLGKMNGTLEFLNLYTRSSKESRKVIWNSLKRFDCTNNIPWHAGTTEDTTVLMDLVEILTFC